MGGGNGWREGTDPIVRWLRAAAVVVFLIVILLAALDRDRATGDLVAILGTAVGAVLVLLGFEGSLSSFWRGKGGGQ